MIRQDLEEDIILDYGDIFYLVFKDGGELDVTDQLHKFSRRYKIEKPPIIYYD
jgi:hypothetical protein